MRTAAGQCCFFALPDRDVSGRSAHARVRTHEDLCSGWLVLHKVGCWQHLAPSRKIAFPRNGRQCMAVHGCHMLMSVPNLQQAWQPSAW